MINNPELNLANKFVQQTNRNIFLTGKAGTGKTTFLRNLRLHSPKRMVVVAPTGVAAINAGGVTIHSFFQIPFGPSIPERLTGKQNAIHKFNKTKIKILKSLDMLVIDEISMVRADLLDAIDEVLRTFKNKDLPFGGVQLLLIGDIQQLAPIAKPEEWSILRSYYDTIFFFSSIALKESSPVFIELKHIYRQKDKSFITILNEVRNNCISPKSTKHLNERYIPDFKPKKNDGYIYLTTHNNYANRVNKEELDNIKKEEHKFKASTTGEFPEHIYPTDFQLSLKLGAQVMFVKNDSKPEKRFFNGKIGTITHIEKSHIIVKCKDDNKSIEVEKETWENIRYTLNKDNSEIEEEVIGTYLQYPLRLAWAITIHKSQGLTFDKAIIDAEQAFAHGQTYVALSRCKTLEGIVLSSPISKKSIICDDSVISFNKEVEENQPDNIELSRSKKNYELSLIRELFDYKTVHYYLRNCKKELQNHDYIIQGNLLDVVSKLEENIDRAFEAVSNSFIKQVRELLQESIEDSDTLQDRIKKASEYFLGKTREELLKPIKEASFSCDNTSVRTIIKDNIQKLHENLKLKLACQEHCLNGFNIKGYLNVKTKTLIKLTDSTVKIETAGIEYLAENPDLFKKLRMWRLELSRELNISAYNILSDKMMLDISKLIPQTATDLSKVKGVGGQRIKKYGNDILTIIRQFRKDNNIQGTMQTLL
jgi:hypothetical protein